MPVAVAAIGKVGLPPERQVEVWADAMRAIVGEGPHGR